MDFSYFRESLDPDGDQKEYTFRFILNAGESLSSAVVETVDADSLAPLSTDLVFISTAFAVISGNTWGVTTWLRGGVVGAYYLRCHVVTDSTPIPRKADHTMRLNVAQH